MLKIISIYKVTDFAPLFCYCDHGRAASPRIYLCKVIRMVSVHLSDTKITTNNLQSEFASSNSAWLWLRNLHDYSLLASLTN